MKKLLLPAFVSLSLAGFAQKPTLADDLNANKDKVREQTLPSYNGQMLYANFQVSPEQFMERAEKVRKDIYRTIESGNVAEQKLKRRDADVYALNLLDNYKMMYGLDSAEVSNLEKLFVEKKDAPDFETLLMAVYVKVQPKKLAPAQRSKLDSIIFAKTGPDDAALFKRSASYRNWVGGYLNWKRATTYKSDTTFSQVKGAMPLNIITTEIHNPFIREYMCYSQAAQNLMVLKNAAQADKVYHDFRAAVNNPYYREQLKQTYDNFRFLNTPNILAPDFNYASIDDKKVNLSDLRGKYVYIDVWATWCAPCKAEIPSLQKVEHDYAGKNIQFVSLSVDRMADKSKWEKYVKENKLGGIQLMADKDFSSEFIKKFNIAAIPRFILIDPQGKVVAGDALRPSDPLLRQQIDKLLSNTINN